MRVSRVSAHEEEEEDDEETDDEVPEPPLSLKETLENVGKIPSIKDTAPLEQINETSFDSTGTSVTSHDATTHVHIDGCR